MVFVDTGAWFAFTVPGDPDHQSALEFIRVCRDRLLSTDYVVDELLTLFRARRQRQRSSQWIETVLLSGAVEMVGVTADDFQRALAIYQNFDDKSWSFTDCTSFVVMERLSIAKAFSFDDHFRQFGRLEVFPS